MNIPSGAIVKEFEAVVNDIAPWELVNEAAKELQLKTKTYPEPLPARGLKILARFSNLTNSLLFGIGAGKKQPQLHEGHYDFPDEIYSGRYSHTLTGVIEKIKTTNRMVHTLPTLKSAKVPIETISTIY